MITYKFFKGLPDDAKIIRNTVFVKEQGFAEEFIPGEDDNAICLVIYLDDKPIATGRILKEDPETYHIGRVAVLKSYRNQKVGSTVLSFLETKIKEIGGRKATIGSQLDKKEFYEKCGYRVINSHIYYEENVPHIMMGKLLK